MNKKILLTIGLFVGVWLVFQFFPKGCAKPQIPAEPVLMPSPEPSMVEDSPIQVPPPAPTPEVSLPKPKKKDVVAPAAQMIPPPVQIHKELIPKNVEIVRVYYAQAIAAPGSSIEFDINGSGFTSEFEKMIKTESGHEEVAVRNLTLMTPNQIHGTLVISPKAATKISFPQVLIKDKVVFQAPDPFGVIRSGEVLNLIFTEMGESGRTGRFRVFTNLDQGQLKDFRVEASTPAIQIGPLRPALPFILDGDIMIGPAAGGEYGLAAYLGNKTLWKRDGIIRVVRPNVGQTGLIQRMQALEMYHRPGDPVVFALQGSGFRPEDTGLLGVRITDLEIIKSTFVYLAPGRLEMSVWLPSNAPVKSYGVAIVQGETVLLEDPKAFNIVDKNWLRGFRLDSPVKPGGEGKVILVGRDLEKNFVSNLKVDVDEPELLVGPFEWMRPDEAVATLKVGSSVKPGDYLIHLSVGGKTLTPQFGGIIQISK